MITLTNQQDEAVSSIKGWYRDLDKPVFYLGGLAGTGKSTLISPIIDALNLNLDDIALIAPTGMAAQVVRDKLAKWDVHTNTSTIHKAIYQPKPSKPDIILKQIAAIKAKLALSPANHYLLAQLQVLETNLERAYDVHDLRFALNPEASIMSKKLIIVDESSMVGMDVAEDLKSFDVPIVAIGDPGQLRPVGDSPGLCVGKADYLLTEIHRQAQDNPIISYSHLVRRGVQMPHGDYGKLKIIRPGDDHFTCAPDREAQIIVGMNKTRWEITRVLRLMNGYETDAPQIGEPLMICKNSREHTSLVNGTLVTSTANHPELERGRAATHINIKDMDGKSYKLKCFQGVLEENTAQLKGYSSAEKGIAYRARKDLEHIDFGWVLTCHKAQGSSWKQVIVHDESRVFQEDATNWLYTAATRAEDELVVVRS